MVLRTVAKTVLIGTGALLAGVLLDSGAAIQAQFPLYGFALLLMLGATFPRPTAHLLGVGILLTSAYGATYGGGTPPLGLSWMHILTLLVTSGVLFALGQPTLVNLWKCPRCYWEGPHNSLRYGHCPACGYAHVKDAHRSIIRGT